MTLLSDKEQEELLQWENKQHQSHTTTDRITRGVINALREIELGKNIDRMLAALETSDYARLLEMLEKSYKTTQKIDARMQQQLTAEIRALSARASTFKSSMESK